MTYGYYQPYWLNDDELEHYGVKGQKWGIRNYQNVDGTLTAAGKERYSTENQRSSFGSSDRRGGGFSKTVTNSSASNYKKGLSATAQNGYNKNAVDFLQHNKDTKSKVGKYQTQSMKSDRIIKAPVGFETTKQQRENFYSNVSKYGSYTSNSAAIPGATIYTYTALVDSPEGEELLKSQEQPYSDCIIKSLEVDWNTGVIKEHRVVAKDDDMLNITKFKGNSALNNWKNSVANAQIQSKVRAQAIEKKVKDIMGSAIKTVGKGLSFIKNLK